MIDSYLRKIEERCEKATKGEWVLVNELDPNPIFLETWGPDYKTMWYVQTGHNTKWWQENHGRNFSDLRNIIPAKTHCSKEDAEFIAHSRTDIPTLVKLLRLVISQRNRYIDTLWGNEIALALREMNHCEGQLNDIIAEKV